MLENDHEMIKLVFFVIVYIMHAPHILPAGSIFSRALERCCCVSSASPSAVQLRQEKHRPGASVEKRDDRARIRPEVEGCERGGYGRTGEDVLGVVWR